MARPIRIEYRGAFYHITARGNERRDIYRDKKDFSKFIEILKEYAERYGVRIHCFVLMNNHYHLLVETPGANLTAFMHNVQSHYSGYFNNRHKRAGHLFQGRYKALVVDKDSYIVELSRYIHLNPVRAGLVRRPGAWEWSSYGDYTNSSGPGKEWIATAEILNYFGKRKKTAGAKYAEYVMSGCGEPAGGMFDGVTAQLILGPEEFVEEVKRQIGKGKKRIDREIISGRELAGWTEKESEKALEIIAEVFSVGRQELLEKGGHHNKPREAAIMIFHKYSSWRVSEIGEKFGVSGGAVCKAAARCGKAIKKDPETESKIARFCSIFSA